MYTFKLKPRTTNSQIRNVNKWADNLQKFVQRTIIDSLIKCTTNKQNEPEHYKINSNLDITSNIQKFGPGVVQKSYNLRLRGNIAFLMYKSGFFERHVQYNPINLFNALPESTSP